MKTVELFFTVTCSALAGVMAYRLAIEGYNVTVFGAFLLNATAVALNSYRMLKL